MVGVIAATMAINEALKCSRHLDHSSQQRRAPAMAPTPSVMSSRGSGRRQIVRAAEIVIGETRALSGIIDAPTTIFDALDIIARRYLVLARDKGVAMITAPQLRAARLFGLDQRQLGRRLACYCRSSSGSERRQRAEGSSTR